LGNVTPRIVNDSNSGGKVLFRGKVSCQGKDGHLSESQVTRPHDPRTGANALRVSLESMARQCTYWRQCSANPGFVENIKFVCPGDGPVNVGFHGDGGRDSVNGQWTVFGDAPYGCLKWGVWAEPCRTGPARGVLVDCCA